ncbi:MAG: NAD(P)-dependent oxidoreductase [Candidatus Heimdallarchaeota archaeon]|nr:NAD(P)-dependent oxidoreductase [Candidatus Heimdallarchaeota archaeon]MCK4954831.1 NAD(P)-dependent oxidoreductase [Candidatus Heimdallarchaeota archaeon]
MKVLLTGAFGNVGQRTLEILLKKGYSVRCFDLRNSRNLTVESKMSQFGDFETVWGDIRDSKVSDKVVKGVHCIIHLAAIIPPLAYEYPELAYEVNVKGSINLIQAAEKLVKPPRFIYASSIAVHGNRMNKDPPTRVDDSFDPLEYDNYAHHKIEVERRIWESKIPWAILRFAAVTPYELAWKIPDLMFDIPLDQRIESVDSRDVGLACANAVEAAIVGKTLFIGGGKGNQIYQRDYVKNILNVLGIGMLPEEAFRPVKNIDDFYHCDWMDTKKAQELLKFQRFTFDDFLNVFKKKILFRRILISIFKPIVRAILLRKSPYYGETKRRKQARVRMKGEPTVS